MSDYDIAAGCLIALALGTAILIYLVENSETAE